MNAGLSVSAQDARRSVASRILVADDSVSGRELLRAILESSGYEVMEAEDGEQVLARAAAFAPELMIIDLMMPKLDGCSTAKALRQMPAFAKTPLVALTAAALDSVPEQIAAAGFNCHLVKPIAPSRLRRCIAGLL